MNEQQEKYSYFKDKILPQVFGVVVTSVAVLFAMYFRLSTLDTRVSALEGKESITGSQVITNTAVIVGVQDDVKEMKLDIKELLRRTPER